MTTTVPAHDTRRAADELLGWVPTGCAIGGSWRDASDGSVIEVFDPATEEVIARVADGSPADAAAAAAPLIEALA